MSIKKDSKLGLAGKSSFFLRFAFFGVGGLGLSRFGNSSTTAQHFIDHTIEYPGGIWQIYANYTRLFYYIHSYNDFILQDVGEYRDKFIDRLVWGYDGILLNDEVASSGYSGSLAVSLGAGLTMTPILSDGYTTGSFYWTNIIPSGPDYNAELGEIPVPLTVATPLSASE